MCFLLSFYCTSKYIWITMFQLIKQYNYINSIILTKSRELKSLYPNAGIINEIHHVTI